MKEGTNEKMDETINVKRNEKINEKKIRRRKKKMKENFSLFHLFL